MGVAKLIKAGFKKTQTKTPILFMDNTIDPITSAYYEMSAFFDGSVVLLQDAIGVSCLIVSISQP